MTQLKRKFKSVCRRSEKTAIHGRGEQGSMLLVLLLAVSLSLSCGRKNMFDEADSHILKMTPEQKIGQLLMFALPGGGFGKTSEQLMKKYSPGGIILFGYNGNDSKKIRRLVDAYQAASAAYSGIPLFVSIDQEGGKVKRITKGVTQFPGNMAAGAVGDDDLVYEWARILGIELRRGGINMNLAPSVDVNNNPENPVINTRSFGSDVKNVSALGVAYIQGLQKSKCIAVAKHFPGHGDTDKDSHLILPVIRFGMDRLRALELAPFRAAIKNDVECIMTAHIAYPEILGTMESATVSYKILTELLRNEMGFDGIIITDDLEMHAIAKNLNIGQAALKSVLAGTDIILISSHGKNVEDIYKTLSAAYRDGTLTEERLNQSVRRILEMKMRYGIMNPSEKSGEGRKYLFTRDEVKLLEGARELNRKISSRSICYAGNLQNVYHPGDTRRVFYMEEYRLKKRIARKGNNIFVSSEELDSFFIDQLGSVSRFQTEGLFDFDKYEQFKETENGKNILTEMEKEVLIRKAKTLIISQFNITDDVLLKEYIINNPVILGTNT